MIKKIKILHIIFFLTKKKIIYNLTNAKKENKYSIKTQDNLKY